MFRTITAAALALPVLAGAFELDDYRIVDLSHGYGEETLYWPTSPSAFRKETLAYGDEETGYFYSAYSVCTPEHGGTHIDAPYHFAEKGETIRPGMTGELFGRKNEKIRFQQIESPGNHQ